MFEAPEAALIDNDRAIHRPVRRSAGEVLFERIGPGSRIRHRLTAPPSPSPAVCSLVQAVLESVSACRLWWVIARAVSAR
jgi:hypothetical protein